MGVIVMRLSNTFFWTAPMREWFGGLSFMLQVWRHLDQLAICLTHGFLINLKILGTWFGSGLLLFAGPFGDIETILFLTISKLIRFCRLSSGERIGYVSERSCSVMSKPKTYSPRWANFFKWWLWNKRKEGGSILIVCFSSFCHLNRLCSFGFL